MSDKVFLDDLIADILHRLDVIERRLDEIQARKVHADPETPLRPGWHSD